MANENDRRDQLLDMIVDRNYDGLSNFAREEALQLIAHIARATENESPDWADVHDTARRIMISTGALLEFDRWEAH